VLRGHRRDLAGLTEFSRAGLDTCRLLHGA
jgi:hypothetical protein